VGSSPDAQTLGGSKVETMNKLTRCRNAVGGALGLAVALAASMTWATGNIDTNNCFAWSENAGWINFAPQSGGVTVTPAGLSGYAWAENIGWVQLAYTNQTTYNNTSATDWGVKLVGKALQGFAWSESVGWINFNPQYGGVTITNGWFYGYAWSENLGWIHFKNASPAYGVRTTATPLGSAVFVM